MATQCTQVDDIPTLEHTVLVDTPLQWVPYEKTLNGVRMSRLTIYGLTGIERSICDRRGLKVSTHTYHPEFAWDSIYTVYDHLPLHMQLRVGPSPYCSGKYRRMSRLSNTLDQ